MPLGSVYQGSDPRILTSLSRGFSASLWGQLVPVTRLQYMVTLVFSGLYVALTPTGDAVVPLASSVGVRATYRPETNPRVFN